MMELLLVKIHVGISMISWQELHEDIIGI